MSKKPYSVDPKPCACAMAAIKRGYLALDPDCKRNHCKEMRKKQKGTRH